MERRDSPDIPSQKKGVLTPYSYPEATGIPDAYIDPESYWTGFGGRARVCLVNTELMDPEDARAHVRCAVRRLLGLSSIRDGTVIAASAT